MKHTTIILYGDEQVRKYLDGIALTNQEISEFTKKYSFNTIENKAVYCAIKNMTDIEIEKNKKYLNEEI